MEYIDYYLKFSSKEEADGVLFDVQTVSYSEEETTIQVPKYGSVDVVGTIYKPTGKMITVNMDGQKTKVPEMAPVDGWHVNVRSEVPVEELESYRVFPSTPSRVWF